MIKQRVAIETLKDRNVNYLNNQVFDGSLNVHKAELHAPSQRLHLPLLFVKVPTENNDVKIAQDESHKLMKLDSDNTFELMDENDLFEAMGLH